MNKSRLLARKEELTLQFEQMKQQANALAGALADIEFWLKELGDDPPAESQKQLSEG